jgi:DNA-binding PadR family transcriptional regulator
LVKQLVDIEILYLLTFSPKSGYELRKQLLNWFKINVSYGTLYPHLHSLERTGFITGKWHQKFDSAPLRKRIYSLTQAGKEVLRGSIESLTKIALTMQFMMTRVNISAQIPSALENKDALARIENFFVERDYTVRKSVILRGFSGIEYTVDLIASSPGPKPSQIIVRVIDKSPITMDEIVKTQVMSFELEADHSIILSSSPISEETSKQAEFYHISIFSGRDLDAAASAMCTSYKL